MENVTVMSQINKKLGNEMITNPLVLYKRSGINLEQQPAYPILLGHTEHYILHLCLALG
jgi:hypothetical protein